MAAWREIPARLNPPDPAQPSVVEDGGLLEGAQPERGPAGVLAWPGDGRMAHPGRKDPGPARKESG
jgi:hypothetical protein